LTVGLEPAKKQPEAPHGLQGKYLNMISLVAMLAAGALSAAQPTHCGFMNLRAEPSSDGGALIGGILDCDAPAGYHIYLQQVNSPLVSKDIEISDHPTVKIFIFHLEKEDLGKVLVLKANK
jgi:hypothetical protein